MSSIIFCLLVFVSIGIVRNQGIPFGDYDNDGFRYNPFFNDGYNRGSANAHANAEVNDNYGGYSNGRANAGINDYGSYSNAEASAGTSVRVYGPGNSRTDSLANAYVDQYGNIYVKANSHAESGYNGQSSSASSGAAATINQYGQPVAAAGAAGSYAGPGGISNALSTATATGGSNLRNYGHPNYSYYNRQPFFNSKSNINENDIEKKAEHKVDDTPIVFPEST